MLCCVALSCVSVVLQCVVLCNVLRGHHWPSLSDLIGQQWSSQRHSTGGPAILRGLQVHLS